MEALKEFADTRSTPTAVGTASRHVRPCMVSFYFHPDYSGSAVQALSLSRHLMRLGVEPFLVAANLRDAAPREAVDGVTVYRLPVLKHPNLQVPSFMVSLAWFLLRHRRHCDVIHAHGTLQHGIAALAGRVLRKPTVLKVAMANSDIAFSRQGRLWGAVNRFMVSRFDRYIATTGAIAREFAAQRLDTSRVRQIPNGVDTERYRPATSEERDRLRQELGLREGPLVAFVGIISARKNVDGILRIFQAAVSEGAPGHLLLIGPIPGGEGDAFYRSALAFVAEHGLSDRVSFVGQVSGVHRYLSVADIFLFPSRQEGMPNAVLEAMASGLACVVSRGAGTDALIQDGFNGFSRALDDEAGFIDVLRRLLDGADCRQLVASAARATVCDRFSLTAVAEQYAGLYEGLLREP